MLRADSINPAALQIRRIRRIQARKKIKGIDFPEKAKPRREHPCGVLYGQICF